MATLRTVHGAERNFEAEVVLEDEPLDEKPSAPAHVADPIGAGRDAAGRVRTREAAKALASLPRRRSFQPRDIVVAKGFEYHYRERLAWFAQRVVEVTDLTGRCSNGTTMRLRKSAWCWAWSEFADELAAATGDLARAEQAARLAEKADKLDWSAWTMAVRESAGKKDGGGDSLSELKALMGSVDVSGLVEQLRAVSERKP